MGDSHSGRAHGVPDADELARGEVDIDARAESCEEDVYGTRVLFPGNLRRCLSYERSQ